MAISKKYIFLVIMIIAISGIGIMIYLRQLKVVQEPIQQDVPQNKWEYVLEKVDESSSMLPNDKRIVKINLITGEKAVLVESVKKEIPELTVHSLLTISKIGEALPKIFLIESLTTHVSPCKLFSFDVMSKEFKEMKLTEYFCGKHCADGICGLGFISPDTSRALMPSEDEDANGKGFSRILWLLDFKQDEVVAIVRLSNNETLNKGYSGDYSSFDVKWLDNNTIEYTVYDQSKVISTAIDKPLIGIRKIELEK